MLRCYFIHDPELFIYHDSWFLHRFGQISIQYSTRQHLAVTLHDFSSWRMEEIFPLEKFLQEKVSVGNLPPEKVSSGKFFTGSFP